MIATHFGTESQRPRSGLLASLAKVGRAPSTTLTEHRKAPTPHFTKGLDMITKPTSQP